jgi:ribosomal protein S18 acetylase RimI-like enzyme
VDLRQLAVDVRIATPEDYDDIVAVLDRWWGRSMPLPRLFLDHFHETSFVAHDGGGLAGFLVGLHPPSGGQRAYIHLVGVRPDRRGSGLGRDLYERFFTLARRSGRVRVAAITSPVNLGSVAFHRRMGFAVSGPVADYNGPGQDRFVFVRDL